MPHYTHLRISFFWGYKETNKLRAHKETIKISLTIVSVFFMSLNNLILPESVIAGLYGCQLVVLDNTPPTAPREKDEKTWRESVGETPRKKQEDIQGEKEEDYSLKFLGNNARRVILLVNNPSDTFLPDEELTLLTQILNACELTLADVAIINMARSKTTITVLQEKLAPRQLIMLGTESGEIDLPMEFPDYRILEHGRTVYLKAPALKTMMGKGPEARNIKMNLWQSLKTMFGK